MDEATLVSRLNEAGTRADCVMCGKNAWRGMGDPSDVELIALLTPLPDGSYAVGHGQGAYGLACGNCGFVRLHAVNVLGLE